MQVVLGVARRQTDVLRRERRAERVYGRIEPERLVAGAERAGDRQRELVLRLRRVAALDELLGLVVARCRDEVLQRGLEPVEHATHLVRPHPRLEVVEEGVVRIVGRREASMYRCFSSSVRSSHGRKHAKSSSARAFAHASTPSDESFVISARERRRGRGAPSPSRARDRDQAGVVRLGIELGDSGARLLEELADLVADEELVREAADRREAFGAGRRAAGGIITSWSHSSTRAATRGR